MNHKIKLYIEHQRNLSDTSINDDSGSLNKAGKYGKEFEQDMLEAMNNIHLFDEPTSFKLFMILSVSFNVIILICLLTGLD
jgi:hypothetical protein